MPVSLARVPPPTARPAVGRPVGGPFTRIELIEDFDSVVDAWTEIAAASFASPYQSLAFARDWAATIGASLGATPLIVIARNEAGAATALLPLGRFRLGPVHLTTFLGGRFANYQMGLFRADVEWPRHEIEALLRATAARARPRIDAFVFINQPHAWRGVKNPLAALPLQASPSPSFASALPASHGEWLDAHFSRSARKKFRKKLRKLEAFGPVSRSRAIGSEEIRAALDAFLAQKRARARALGLPLEFDPPSLALLERLTGLTAPRDAPAALELHVLRAGERIVAVFGGLADAHGLSGSILSFDGAPEVAAASPGEYLVTEIAGNAIERGLAQFDLGIGEARYKKECCEATVPLFDSAFAITSLGRLAAAAFRISRGLKRRVKQSPRLFALAINLRRRFG